MNKCEEFRFSEVPRVKVGLIHLDRKRPWPSSINPETGREWSLDVKTRMLEILDNSGFSVHRSDNEVTVNDDPSLRTALASCAEAGCDVLVCIQPTISDGRLAPVIAQQWGKGIVFWASPEEQTGEMISGNSLVGTHLMSATLRQLGRQVEMVYNNLAWDMAEKSLKRAVNIGFASRNIRLTKIALIGHQAPGFVDFHPNPFLMSKTFGIVFQHVGLTEYISTALDAITNDDVEKDEDHVLNDLKFPLKDKATGFGTDKSDLAISSRHYLAMKKLVSDNNFDALAIRCWPELPGPAGLGQWPYMALARMATDGFPAACEGDIDGALGCLVAKMLGCGVVYLSDWLEHDETTLTLWHGGVAPTQLSENVGTPLGPCIARHFNNKVPGCLDATIKIGIKVTVFRFWVMDNKYHLVVFEGTTKAPKRHILGNNGLVEVRPPTNLVEGFARWVDNGFPHHVCVINGWFKKELEQFSRNHSVVIV